MGPGDTPTEIQTIFDIDREARSHAEEVISNRDR